ncbi:MAG: ferrous iron transport protein A, partial [Oscillochloris sp.]|nr:ferrous iron transport protein A [Oscillochloris sp.]
VLRDNGGTLLVAVGDTRLALGAGIAHTVLVTALDRSSADA